MYEMLVKEIRTHFHIFVACREIFVPFFPSTSAVVTIETSGAFAGDREPESSAASSLLLRLSGDVKVEAHSEEEADQLENDNDFDYEPSMKVNDEIFVQRF